MSAHKEAQIAALSYAQITLKSALIFVMRAYLNALCIQKYVLSQKKVHTKRFYMHVYIFARLKAPIFVSSPENMLTKALFKELFSVLFFWAYKDK